MGKPVLKWAGGKTQTLNEIERSLPIDFKNGVINRYAEPFFGGGAVYFYLAEKYEIKEAYLSDINIEIILLYKVIQKHLNDLILELEILAINYENKTEKEAYFYKIRDLFNKNEGKINLNIINKKDIIRVAHLIFLNKTCFNGLFRVNSKGLFNVPFGRYKNPTILNLENLNKASYLLTNAIIKNACYSEIPERFLTKSFLYLDPPYRPLNKSSCFTSYSKSTFNDSNQIELGNFLSVNFNNNGLYFILSNSDPKNTDKEDNFFDDLYSDFNIKRIKSNRMINSKGSKRGSVSELLITNFKD